MMTSSSNPEVTYEMDISNPSKDVFDVTVHVTGLTDANNIYNFASTAPGTYDVMDFGKLVKSFYAFDKNGASISVDKISVNKYKISKPADVAKIVYSIEDSFDATPIAPMSGTNISMDFSLINTFGTLGYFEGLQSLPVKLKVMKPADWTIGTALDLENGYYTANSYDHLADSPIITGNLTQASTNVDGIEVNIFVYSSTDAFKAESILQSTQEILSSARKFIGFNAADRYTFLMAYVDGPFIQANGFQGFGALEHQKSSAYVLPVNIGMGTVADIMAHEFFHIVTPLNIHSEVIAKYNFATPTPSEHLWLYEGVTEWASDVMQVRNGLQTEQEFLDKMGTKLRNNDQFDKSYSLSKLALNAYIPEGTAQYGNIYEKGALVASLLDIRLLELSNGERGLRELLIELSGKYGQDNYFDDKRFFDELVAMTYPEIRQFINDYIRGTKELPIAEYYGKLGFEYTDSRVHPTRPLTVGVNVGANQGGFFIASFKDGKKVGNLMAGDKVKAINGTELTFQNARATFDAAYANKNVGDVINVKIERDGETLDAEIPLIQRMENHILTVSETLTPEQQKFKALWKKNK
jgi:predicted metalloprotease with PDZ domain